MEGFIMKAKDRIIMTQLGDHFPLVPALINAVVWNTGTSADGSICLTIQTYLIQASQI